MFASAVASTVKNKKKRKRPRAKDWPPTSAQKKNLVPYGSRPWKLPRLNEAPYVDIWLKIISYIKQENVTRFRKFRYFRGVHKELIGATWNLRESRFYTPLHIDRVEVRGSVQNLYNLKLYVLQDEYFQAPRSAIYILKWIPYSTYKNTEQLAWVCQEVDDVTPVTNLNKDQSNDIFRYTDICAWESANSDFLYKYKWKRMYCFEKGWRKGCLERMIRTAPKVLDRENAAIRVGILLEKYVSSCIHPDERSVKKL